jgi:hypothetical protein
VAWVFVSRASFGEGPAAFCQCLLGAVLVRPALLRGWTLMGRKRLSESGRKIPRLRINATDRAIIVRSGSDISSTLSVLPVHREG